MSKHRSLALLLLVAVSMTIARGAHTDSHYTVEDIINSRCAPGQACYPTEADVAALDAEMTGTVVRKTDSSYDADNLMYNINQQRDTNLIAMVESKEDIQKAVLFARKFNLHVTIKSTGHDYCGRSTWDRSFVIHLGKMDNIEVNTSPTERSEYGELKTETGTNWETIYRLLDTHNRTIVGGSAHTVGPGGYTLGGGHSPISRTHGYAVDNVLEMQVVLPDGSIATCTDGTTTIRHANGTWQAHADGDLLWALRGGGGGTFGVTVYIVYKLHPQPRQMVTFSGTFPLIYESGAPFGDILDGVMSAMSNFILNSPSYWGGYWILSNRPIVYQNVRMRGSLFLFLNKFAPWNNNEERELAEFIAMKNDYNLVDIQLMNRSSFWDYERNAQDPPSANVYLVASMLDREQARTSLASFVRKELMETWDDKFLGCTGILVGDKTTEPSVDSSPLNPGYRSAVSVLSCGTEYFQSNVADAKEFAYRLRTMGQGMYLNEPSIDSIYWREDFWGKTNYERLLQIKRRYDQDNFFTCYHCVNSDNAAYPPPQNETANDFFGSNGNAQTGAHWFGLLLAFVLALLF